MTIRFIDLIMAVLQAHGESLRELSKLLGEDELTAILEMAGDTLPESPIRDLLSTLPLGNGPMGPSGMPMNLSGDRPARRSPYVEIEASVREMRLPATLEFYAWTYPHYRALIESSHDLEARFAKNSDREQINLVEELVRQARAWVRALPIPPSDSLKAEKAVEACWLRFRAQVLPRLGARPFRTV